MLYNQYSQAEKGEPIQQLLDDQLIQIYDYTLAESIEQHLLLHICICRHHYELRKIHSEVQTSHWFWEQVSQQLHSVQNIICNFYIDCKISGLPLLDAGLGLIEEGEISSQRQMSEILWRAQQILI